jgi:hypothetical protein
MVHSTTRSALAVPPLPEGLTPSETPGVLNASFLEASAKESWHFSDCGRQFFLYSAAHSLREDTPRVSGLPEDLPEIENPEGDAPNLIDEEVI